MNKQFLCSRIHVISYGLNLHWFHKLCKLEDTKFLIFKLLQPSFQQFQTARDIHETAGQRIAREPDHFDEFPDD